METRYFADYDPKNGFENYDLRLLALECAKRVDRLTLPYRNGLPWRSALEIANNLDVLAAYGLKDWLVKRVVRKSQDLDPLNPSVFMEVGEFCRRLMHFAVSSLPDIVRKYRSSRDGEHKIWRLMVHTFGTLLCGAVPYTLEEENRLRALNEELQESSRSNYLNILSDLAEIGNLNEFQSHSIRMMPFADPDLLMRVTFWDSLTPEQLSAAIQLRLNAKHKAFSNLLQRLRESAEEGDFSEFSRLLEDYLSLGVELEMEPLQLLTTARELKGQARERAIEKAISELRLAAQEVQVGRFFDCFRQLDLLLRVDSFSTVGQEVQKLTEDLIKNFCHMVTVNTKVARHNFSPKDVEALTELAEEVGLELGVDAQQALKLFGQQLALRSSRQHLKDVFNKLRQLADDGDLVRFVDECRALNYDLRVSRITGKKRFVARLEKLGKMAVSRYMSACVARYWLVIGEHRFDAFPELERALREVPKLAQFVVADTKFLDKTRDLVNTTLKEGRKQTVSRIFENLTVLAESGELWGFLRMYSLFHDLRDSSEDCVVTVKELSRLVDQAVENGWNKWVARLRYYASQGDVLRFFKAKQDIIGCYENLSKEFDREKLVDLKELTLEAVKQRIQDLSLSPSGTSNDIVSLEYWRKQLRHLSDEIANLSKDDPSREELEKCLELTGQAFARLGILKLKELSEEGQVALFDAHLKELSQTLSNYGLRLTSEQIKQVKELYQTCKRKNCERQDLLRLLNL